MTCRLVINISYKMTCSALVATLVAITVITSHPQHLPVAGEIVCIVCIQSFVDMSVIDT